MSNQYPIDNTIFENARAVARDRAAYQWENPNRWNMWTVYRQSFNQEWFDPWYESETWVPENVPNEDEDLAWRMFKNAYYVYCWLKFCGYNEYSIATILTSATQESGISGGGWERGYSISGSTAPLKHPYANLKDFDATSTNGNGESWEWYVGGVKPNFEGRYYSYGNSGASLTNYKMTYTKPYVKSWQRVKQWPLIQMTVFDPYNDGHGMTVVPEGYRYYESEGSTALRFNESVGRTDCRGYGFIQWTPWTILPRTAADAAGNDDYQYYTTFADGNKHWQMNGSLQLLIWDYERFLAMNDDYQGGPGYLGQWVDSNAASQSDMGAYFTWPYQSQYRYYYKKSITWDDFIAGTYLEDFEDMLDEMVEMGRPVPQTLEDVDWCRRQLSMAIWRSCYIHTIYYDPGTSTIPGYREISASMLAAIRYWDAHPISGRNGWSILDVPRPRDLPFCFLDNYHISTGVLTMYLRRRKNNNVCTILL